MRRTISPADMRTLEMQWMAETGVPSVLLMEEAARGVAAALARYAARTDEVLFVCGPGNNGGDGYAAARLWHTAGGQAVVLETPGERTGDPLMERTLCEAAGIPILPAQDDISSLPGAGVIVDALFGTGLSRMPEGLFETLIRLMNGSGRTVIAADVPSGLDGTTGAVPGAAVRARETVTFHRIKHGLLLGEGAACSGRLTVWPILIPEAYGNFDGFDCAEPDDLDALGRRPVMAHKGDLGRVVIFAGSAGMTGAAAMCARACIKAGAGLTYLLCRESILPLLQVLVPGAVTVALPEINNSLQPGAAEIAASLLKNADSAVIGCGLGQQADAYTVLDQFRKAECPVVWDADALNLLAAEGPEHTLPVNACLTPHPGEAARLLHCTVPQVTANMSAALATLQAQYGCRVLLKGARTLMGDGERMAVNRWGTPAMSKGGSGDILSGILAAVLARRSLTPKVTDLQLIQTAAMIHGLAGLRAANALGEDCVTPEDLIGAIRLDAKALPEEVL